MPIYDMVCNHCGRVHEVITGPDDTDPVVCPLCQMGYASRIISASGVNCSNQDAGWIKSAAEVAGDETPQGRQFKRNPTRDNLQAWMKAKGLRHMDPGEGATKPPPPDQKRILKKMIERYRKRNRITIGG